MSFLLKNKCRYLASLLAIAFFTTAHAELNHQKSTAQNYLKVVTMQPIDDDNIDNLEFSNNDTQQIIDNKDESSNIIHNVSANNNYSESELKCLTQTIYHEARSESYEGGIAVGNVIMNRVNSPKFPNTICGVMQQKTGKMCQFSFMCNGLINKPVHAGLWKKSQNIALDILNGTAPKLSKGALFFHAKYAKLRLASNRYTAKIGQHYFYK